MFRLLSLALTLSFLVACSKSPEKTAAAGIGDNGGLTDLKKSLDDVPTDTPEQVTAVGDAKNGLSDLIDAYGKLKKGISPARLRAALAAIAKSRGDFEKLADELRKAGYDALADAFDEIAAKRDVIRYFNPTTGKHFHATDAAPPSGFNYEGLVFRVYDHVRRNCTITLNRCYLASGDDHYFALDQACGGGEFQEEIGKICPTQDARTALPLARLYKEGDHIQSVNKVEIDHIQQSGWLLEGYIGYTPN